MTDKAEGKAFEDAGFFSHDVNEWSNSYCTGNKSTFDRASDLARIALGLAYRKSEISARFGKLELYIFGVLFIRCISNFQAAIILLRKGMNLEARILARSCLECTFMIAAARKMGTEFVTRMIKQHHDARKKIGLEIEKMHKKGVAFTDEQVFVVRKIIEEHVAGGAETFDFYNIAQKGGLENWYIFYRQLSNYAAHPSLDSLQYFFDGEAEDIVFGPNSDIDDLSDVVDLSCMFLIAACKDFNEHLGEDVALTSQLDEEFRKTKRWRETQDEEPS